MTTSKSLRARAPRKTENYVASIRRLFGDPETVPDKKFLAGKYITNGDFSSVYNEGAYSITEPIGFAVEINGKTYTEFSVATAGWIFLRDPAGGSTGASFWTDILNGFTNIYDNHQISATFSYDHIFLPAWFDRNHSVLRSVSRLAADPNGYSFTLTSDIQNDITAGINTKYWPYDSIDYGVRYVNHYDNKKGKCLLVRWTVTQQYYGNRLKFEIALFENGTIEYRYWPIKTFEPGDVWPATSSTATVGVFWRQVGKTYLWRDFAPLLGYSSTARKLSQLGGAEYDSSYTDSGQYYSNNISTTYWPKNGAVITYSPPVKPLKILPRKIIGEMNSTREIVRSPGLFDDRRTIPFVSGGFVHMPSTLPTRLIGDSGNVDVSLQQLLFVSGSDSGSLFIPSNGRVSKSAVDTQLAQLEAIEKTNKTFDFSFNEGQKNYKATYSSDSFYATGSSVSEFGQGFSSPLKSKTQFYFSLPVTKQSTMPASTASIYYYNADRLTWDLINPSDLGNLTPIIVGGDDPEVGITSIFEYEMDYSGEDPDVYAGIHRVIENGRGFDAVGRKMVSGSLPSLENMLNSTQTDMSIGAIYNSDPSTTYGYRISEKTLVDDALSKKYVNSTISNSAYYPSENQKFIFSGDYPFLIEKIVVDIPLYISGDWFKDVTTCNKAFGENLSVVSNAKGYTSGAIDFGGPGLTFALLCPRSAPGVSYLDIIASGTITHQFDATGSVVLYKDPDMRHYVMRPIGFPSFSNPTAVISGSNNIFNGNVRLEIIPSIAGGVTLARNDTSVITTSDFYIQDNRRKAAELLTSTTLSTKGATYYNTWDRVDDNYDSPISPYYAGRTPRIYVQQISPLSRGTTGVEFNGNSILGGNIAHYNEEVVINNPLYVSESGSLPSSYRTIIDSSDFKFDAISIMSLVDSRKSPYLIYPGDKLTMSFSKTRPVVYKMFGTYEDGYDNAVAHTAFSLTGSHGTVMLNTGSIDITLYGSYVRGGMEFNP